MTALYSLVTRMTVILSLLAVCNLAAKSSDGIKFCCPKTKLSYIEDWGYVDVRPQAHMFWWLYYKKSARRDINRPLILWLQGGPGSSSTGFGNFEEIGPLTASLKPRNTTWLQVADLLFIDNPVGTGYSYVDSPDAYTTDVKGIADDLVSWAKVFFGENHTEYQERPFYIFCESYGGKMTTAFAWALYQAIQQRQVSVNFKGVALGDSWISAIDYVDTWGPYLYATSYLDRPGLNQTQHQASICQAEINAGRWTEATGCWDDMENLISSLTNGVSWYNILKRGGTDPWSSTITVNTDASGARPFRFPNLMKTFLYANTGSLSDLMNGPIKKKLGIPNNVTWGGQSGEVFEKQSDDFMKPVVDTVDLLLSKTNLKVVVFNGQLDLICNTEGTLTWLHRLKWPGIAKFNKAQRQSFSIKSQPDQTAGFYKSYQNFKFYWVMRAGHMVAHDAADTALLMVKNITNT